MCFKLLWAMREGQYCKKKETTHEVFNKIAIEDKGSDYIFCIFFFLVIMLFCFKGNYRPVSFNQKVSKQEQMVSTKISLEIF